MKILERKIRERQRKALLTKIALIPLSVYYFYKLVRYIFF